MGIYAIGNRSGTSYPCRQLSPVSFSGISDQFQKPWYSRCVKLVDLDLERYRPTGLDRLESGKWRARVVLGGKQVTIGYYDHPVYAACP